MSGETSDVVSDIFSTHYSAVHKADLHAVMNPIHYASFFQRFGACVIDFISVLTVTSMISIILGFFTEIRGNAGGALSPLQLGMDIIGVMVWFWYTLTFMKMKNATPGKLFVGIFVTNLEKKPLTFKQILIRETIGKCISISILGLGYFWMLIDSRNQTWHDKMAKTIVILDKSHDVQKTIA